MVMMKVIEIIKIKNDDGNNDYQTWDDDDDDDDTSKFVTRSTRPTKTICI